MENDGWLTPIGLDIKLPMPKFIFKSRNGLTYTYDEALEMWVAEGNKDIVKHLLDIQ